MRKIWLVVFLAACGRDYCERLADEVSGCDGTEPSESDVEQCQEMLEPCNGDDEELLEDSLDCQIDAGLYACEDDADEEPSGTAGTATGFEDFGDLFACFLPLAGISPECASSVGVVGVTPSTSDTSDTSFNSSSL